MPKQAAVAERGDGLRERRTPVSLLLQTAVWTSIAIFWSSALDPYASFKFTAMALCCIGLLIAAAVQISTQRRLELRGRSVLLSVAVFLALGLLTTVVSTNSWRSLVGQRGRATGYVTYVVVGLLFLVVVTCGRRSDVRRVATTIGIAGAGLVIYALLQRIGIDPLRQRSAVYGEHAPIGTLGNANFVAGVGGIALPLLAWRVVEAGATRLRAYFSGALALTVLGILATRSVQGVLAGGLGLAVILAGTVLPGAKAIVRRRLILAGATAALVVVLLVSGGLAGRGPLRAQLDDVGRSQRVEFWEAAASMVADHPVLGVGFDEFGAHYRAYRSEKAALQFGIFETADEPHNVPLGMAVGGGVLLGAAYLSFVIATGWLLVRGLRSTSGPQRGLLLACGGAWLAYQAQSLVSIDGPPLSLLHFLLAGMIVVLVAPPVVVWEQARRARTQRRSPRNAAATPSTRVVGSAAVMGLIAAWFAVLPARAELAAASALDAASSGDGNAAVDRMQRAHEILPPEPVYQAEAGRLLGLADQTAAAAEHYGRAVEREPRNLTFVLPYARLLAKNGDSSGAATWYYRALELEPVAPELRLEVAKFELSRSDWRAVLAQLRPALRLRPDDPSLHLVAGDANVLAGNLDEADRHYDIALRHSPTDTSLRLRLAAAEVGRKRLSRAVIILRDCTKTSPSSEECWLQLGEVLRQSGDVGEARAAYEHALTFTPRDPRADAGLAALSEGTPQP